MDPARHTAPPGDEDDDHSALLRLRATLQRGDVLLGELVGLMRDAEHELDHCASRVPAQERAQRAAVHKCRASYTLAVRRAPIRRLRSAGLLSTPFHGDDDARLVDALPAFEQLLHLARQRHPSGARVVTRRAATIPQRAPMRVRVVERTRS